MPHRIELEGEPRVAVVRIDGAVDLSYWRWVLYDAIWHTRAPAVNRFLFDMRSADLHVEIPELEDIGGLAHRSLAPGFRIACLCRPPESGAPLDGYSGIGGDQHVHLFSSEAEALHWLRSDPREAAA